MHIQHTIFIQRRRQAQQGQTIIIALLVLLLLGFIGGLFSSIVTRNLRSAARSNRVQTADYYAEAGIRFADDQLSLNPDGADWRPALQFQLAANYEPQPATGIEHQRYVVAKVNLPIVAAADPDRPFLEQGFARYNIGTGRFLLRLTYDPAGVNTGGGTTPRGRYIKIESVGREGLVDATDPTTYQNSPAIRLAATLVEYKAIGLTDYARFETNPDKRSDVMALGVASEQYVSDFDSTATLPYQATLKSYPLVTTYGAADAYLATYGATPADTQLTPNLTPTVGSNLATANAQPGGGAIHANGPVRFYGQNFFYLNNTGADTGSYNETLEVAGNLLLDGYGTSSVGGSVSVVTPAMSAPAGGTYLPLQTVVPSNDPNTAFTTLGGAVRDGGNGTDVNGNSRNINRLEPPALDASNPATNLPRYKDVALNSLPRQSFDGSANTAYNAGSVQYGYGRSLYVDNVSDVQSESSSLIGGYTLVDEWLHRTPPGVGNGAWTASFYRPPGVEIVLGRQTIGSVTSASGTPAQKSFYGIRLSRSDVDAAGKPVLWKDPATGKDIAAPNVDGNTGSTMVVSYTSLNASNDPAADPGTLTGSALTAYQANPDNDVVIYAEGNVRVRGSVSADTGATPTDETSALDKLPRHVTIVTNGTAYIDGSLLRGNMSSSISVLAHDYVCVNTTQFLAGAQVDENMSGATPPGPYTGDPNLRALDFSTSDEVLLQEFQFVPASQINGSGAAPSLYISGGPSASGGASADFDLFNPALGKSLGVAGSSQLFLNAGVYNVATPDVPFTVPTQSTGVGSEGLSHTSFVLPTLPAADAILLAVRRTPGLEGSSFNQDFLLERAAILPSDIRIEAVLFAQTRSFFVIPGDWFNTNVNDNISSFQQTQTRSGIDASVNAQKRFPFFGQPVDMKIIVMGSVSEARPADIAAQTAWMEKWGWIPQYHGTAVDMALSPETSNRWSPLDMSATPTAPGVGLTILYNPLAGYPYLPGVSGGAGHYLRTDLYGRPLPYTPKLPVCAGLLYAGQNSTDQPILQ